MGPDGKTVVKESAREKHIGNSKSTSIISKVCYNPSEVNIREFFSNAGLRAAWKMLKPDLRRRCKEEKPELIKYIKEIEDIRKRFNGL